MDTDEHREYTERLQAPAALPRRRHVERSVVRNAAGDRGRLRRGRLAQRLGAWQWRWRHRPGGGLGGGRHGAQAALLPVIVLRGICTSSSRIFVNFLADFLFCGVKHFLLFLRTIRQTQRVGVSGIVERLIFPTRHSVSFSLYYFSKLLASCKLLEYRLFGFGYGKVRS